MQRFAIHSLWIAVLVLVTSSSESQGATVFLDLNDFGERSNAVVATDGLSAELTEGAFVTFLANDPFFGDLIIITPEIGGIPQLLSFHFDFIEPLGNDDEFGAFLFDSDTGDLVGAAFEFFESDSSFGTVTFDLTSLVGGPTLGMEFQLNSLSSDVEFTSVVTVSNVQLNPVPEPTSLAVWGVLAGGLGLIWRRRNSCRV